MSKYLHCELKIVNQSIEANIVMEERKKASFICLFISWYRYHMYSKMFIRSLFIHLMVCLCHLQKKKNYPERNSYCLAIKFDFAGDVRVWRIICVFLIVVWSSDDTRANFQRM